MANFAVFGHPVAHSLSPRIHAMFAMQLGIPLQYVAIDARLEDFDARLGTFSARGGCGANITMPLKHAAFALSTQVTDFAQRAQAVNTLTRLHDGSWAGANTDGAGLTRDLTERHGLDLRERRSILLGAGGAARAAAHALLDAGIGELVIVNRSSERADALVDSIGQPGRVVSRYWADLHNCASFDLVLNATSAGIASESLTLPFSLVAPRALCYDLSYGSSAVGFLAWARAAGAGKSIDGLGMLIEQAAESFEIWHGVRPETDAIYVALRRELPLLASD